MVKDINNTRCVNTSGILSPLPDREIEDIWRDALDYVKENNQSIKKEGRTIIVLGHYMRKKKKKNS
jgi:hypothetical protein